MNNKDILCMWDRYSRLKYINEHPIIVEQIFLLADNKRIEKEIGENLMTKHSSKTKKESCH